MAFLAAVPAAGEPMFKVGQELPQMSLRICAALDDAKAEANKARRLGGEPLKPGVLSSLRNKDCEGAFLVVIPKAHETAIEPYYGWAIVFDSSATEYLRHPRERIPVSVKRVQVRWYRGTVLDRTGTWYEAWFELLDEPYMLKYLEHRQHAR